jgi:hypothetical protein
LDATIDPYSVLLKADNPIANGIQSVIDLGSSIWSSATGFMQGMSSIIFNTTPPNASTEEKRSFVKNNTLVPPPDVPDGEFKIGDQQRTAGLSDRSAAKRIADSSNKQNPKNPGQ